MVPEDVFLCNFSTPPKRSERYSCQIRFLSFLCLVFLFAFLLAVRFAIFLICLLIRC
jgi:hypothetical protein